MKFVLDRDIILIGDFNVPKLAPDDRIAQALKKFGMQPTLHSSYQWTNLSGRNQYDQIAFHPGETKNQFTGRSGVFDFDKAVFKPLWEKLLSQMSNTPGAVGGSPEE